MARGLRVGIVGMGMVGTAVAFGMKRLGHTVIGYDNVLTYATYDELLNTDLAFICVPTPSTVRGACNTSIVESAVLLLDNSKYKGLAVIKSTVPPGTTDSLAKTCPNLRLAFCPEFLRERARFSDFYENHEVCIVGVNESRSDYYLICDAHGSLPKKFVLMSRVEAELAKYFVNCFNAYRINFANAFYDVCTKIGVDYTKIKDAVSYRADTKSSYLDANANLRAFGGACLPKDTRAFAEFVSDLGIPTALFDNIIIENERIKEGDVP